MTFRALQWKITVIGFAFISGCTQYPVRPYYSHYGQSASIPYNAFYTPHMPMQAFGGYRAYPERQNFFGYGRGYRNYGHYRHHGGRW